MNAYLKDDRVYFYPIHGSTPVAADVIEETDGPLGADEDLGAVDSVTLDADGKVRIRRLRKEKSKKTKAREDLAKANTVSELRKALLDYLEP